jgi:hypothetical protein
MSRIVPAAFLVSVLAGCVTSEAPYSRSAISSLERERAPHSVSRREKSTQTAHAPLSRKIQVSLRRYGAEYPMILGTAF